MNASLDPITPARRVERAGVNAWLDLHRAAPSATRARLGLHTRPMDGGQLLGAAHVDHMMFNRLCLARPSAAVEAAAHFASRGTTRYLLTFDREALPAPAPHGLARFHRDWDVLATPEGAPMPAHSPSPGVVIRPTLARHRCTVEALLADAFDVPPQASPVFGGAIGRAGWHVLRATLDGALAGVGMLFLDGAVGYLFAGATAPRFRRRGVQRALVAARVRLAHAAGATLVGSETGAAIPGQPNPSWRNLARAGMRAAHTSAHLCLPGATWA